MAKHPAAFINELSESGTKQEVLRYLQVTYDENYELRNELARLRQIMKENGISERLHERPKR